MKNTNKIIILVLAIIVLGLVAWRYNSSSSTSSVDTETGTTVSVPTSQTVVVSTKLSEYKNEELGFSIKYPTSWIKVESPTNVSLSIPIDEKTKNTIGVLEAKVDVQSGTCAFPPVTTVKERDTLKVGDVNFSMISLSNTVQTRKFFSRIYSLQKDSICYLFTYTANSTNPSSKGYSTADAQKISASNTTLIDSADTAFKDLVMSFKFITTDAGIDETQAPGAKK
jgi:hypothetical protein